MEKRGRSQFQAEGTEWAKAQRCEKAIPLLSTGKVGDMVLMEKRYRGKTGGNQSIEGLAACVRVSGQRTKEHRHASFGPN